MERHMTERPKQPPLFDPDELADRVEKDADKMGWSIDSVRRMLTDDTTRTATRRPPRKIKRGYKSKVPDDDSAHDEYWNVSPELLTDEQIAINHAGAALARAAAQKPQAPEQPHDSEKMIADAMASWDNYIADHKQPRVDSEVSGRGVYVSLDERHMALEVIANVYAQRNRSSGFKEAIADETHAEELYERYLSPKIIADKMAEIALKNEPKLATSTMSLLQADALKYAGFTSEEIATAVTATEQDITDTFGEDARYPDRIKALRPVRAATKKRS